MAEQNKNQRAEKTKIDFRSKHIQLAERFKPITKKLEKFHKSTKKVGELFLKNTSNS